MKGGVEENRKFPGKEEKMMKEGLYGKGEKKKSHMSYLERKMEVMVEKDPPRKVRDRRSMIGFGVSRGICGKKI